MAYSTGSKPWNRLAWSDETMQMIYREWGKFYSKRYIMDKAAHYFTKSMIVNENDVGCLYNRSLAYLHIAKCDESLQDSKAAIGIKKYDSPINLQYSEGFFNKNDFEECITTLHNNKRKFKGGKLKPFKEKISILESTFNDNVSRRLLPFALQNRKTFIKVGQIMRAEAISEDKIRWKKLLEEGRCDAESIEVVPEELLHPREYERKKLAYKVANQCYIGRSWVDVVFLSKLRFDKTLLLKQTPISTKELLNQVEDKYQQVTKFIKMLHARDPLYDLRRKNCPNKKLMEKTKRDHLFRIQTQTRRDMFNFLYKIKELRKEKKIRELQSYVEDVMSNYTIIKIKKVMPWKYEFISEVYSVVALAYLDQMVVPDDIKDYKLENQLWKLLRIEPSKEKESIQYVFGDKSTFVQPDAIDYDYISYKHHVTKLERWLKFSKYPVEKIFIMNLISNYHFDHSKLEDCVQMAIKARNLARNIDNSIWILLCILQILRAQTLQRKFDALVAHYNQALTIVRKFKEASDLQNVFNTANLTNNLLRASLKKTKKLKK